MDCIRSRPIPNAVRVDTEGEGLWISLACLIAPIHIVIRSRNREKPRMFR